MATIVCKIMGLAFIAIAIWGFIDGDRGLIFHVNTTHNIVHLVSGVIALACGFSGMEPAKWFCIIFGAVYGLVSILGLANVEAVNKLLHLNDADDVLHLLIAAVFLAAAFVRARSPSRSDQPAGGLG